LGNKPLTAAERLRGPLDGDLMPQRCKLRQRLLAAVVADPFEVGPDTVAAIGDAMTARRPIDAIVPGIKWLASGGSVESGKRWIEFCVAEGESKVEALMVRTSHNSDHDWESGVINKLCADP
jgi:hypothetical protein